jgi:type I restriction enzyme S subunit
MIRFITTTVEEVAENFDNIRVPLSSKQRKDIAKIFPYYGAQSIIDYVDDFLFDGEYILVAEDGENLKSQNNNVCNLVNGKFWVNNHAHIIKGKDGNNTKYLCYYLNLMNFKPFVTGSAQPKLTKDNLNSIPLKIHNKLEQNQIAKVLSNLDAKIEINNKINQELEAMAKTLYDYWFVQFDFPDKNGKPYKSSGGEMVFNAALKREIPIGWEVKELINLCTRIGDGLHGTPKYVEKSDYSFINGNNLKNGFISTDNDTKKVSAQEYEKHFIELNNNSILLSINGTLGNLAIYNNEKVMLGKSSAYINCKENHRTYCYEYLNQNHMKKVFWNIATGSTIKNLGLESIKKLKILEPNNNLIEQFDQLTKSIENKRINIFKQNQKLSKLRDWLLPMLMNGQITVGYADQEVEALGLVAEGGIEHKKE